MNKYLRISIARQSGIGLRWLPEFALVWLIQPGPANARVVPIPAPRFFHGAANELPRDPARYADYCPGIEAGMNNENGLPERLRHGLVPMEKRGIFHHYHFQEAGVSVLSKTPWHTFLYCSQDKTPLD